MKAEGRPAGIARSTVICIAEDRVSEEIAVRLCIASSRRSNPECPIIAYLPRASASLQHWIAAQSLVDLRMKPLQTTHGCTVKPSALLAVLEERFDDVWWIDTDVLVRRSLTASYGEVDSRIFFATEEALSGDYEDRGHRARALGLNVVRDFSFTLNSGVMRVSACHQTLLRRWGELLESPEYRAAQFLDRAGRPRHFTSDQCVLTGLLCGDEFGDVPVHVLRRGPDIVQYYGPFGYTLRERLGNIFDGGPTFIHCQDFKPWRTAYTDEADPFRSPFKKSYRKLLSETSTYVIEARRFRADVADDLPWTQASSASGNLLRILGFGNHIMTGLPLAIAGDITRVIRWIKKAAQPRSMRRA